MHCALPQPSYHTSGYLHSIIPHLLVSDRSYTSPRALDRCFEPPRCVQCLNLPSSTLTHYREKHRSTPPPHQMSRTTFKLVGTGHRRSSNIRHSTEHPKRRSQYFEAHSRQRVEVLDASVLRRHPCTLDRRIGTHLLPHHTPPEPTTSRFDAFELQTVYRN